MGDPSFRFAGFEFDTASYQLRSGGERIPVEPRAFDLLHHLIVHRDRVVSKEELLDTLWGDRFVGEAALTTALRTARIAIGDSGKEQRLIRTVLRRGYQFVGTVVDTTSGHEQVNDGGVPLPPRMAESLGLGFAGRDDERAALAEACKEVAASEQRHLVMISGEAGIGKTTLCSVVAAAAHRDGAVVLYGRCDEELTVPYQPWRDVIASVERHLPSVLDGHREALAPLLGGSGTQPSGADSDSARFELYSAVVDVLDATSAGDRLTLVVLDDLHWADVQTLALLRHLVQRAMTTPVLVLATFRDSDVDASHPLNDLLAATHRELGTTRLALGHLGDDELLSLLESVAGHEMDSDGLALRDALRAETEGNPFFVTEILRHLAETGAIAQGADGRWAAPTDLHAHGLPISVREVVSRRVERLGSATRSALDLGSVIGRDFELDVLAELLGEDVEQTFERLKPAVDNALVVDASGRFGFAHAIVAHTLYDELSLTERAFSHEAVASVLERRGDEDSVSSIAHHWLQTVSPHGRVKAAEYTQRAGDAALVNLAPDDAVTWYRHSLERLHVDDTAGRCEILVGMGTAQRQAGDPAHRETLLEAGHLAIELHDDDLLVRAALANNRGEVSEFGAVDGERIAMLRAAISARPTGADAALLCAILSIEMQDAADAEVEAMASQALALAREAGDDRVTARVVRLAESALRTPTALDQRERWLHEGIDAAERTGDALLRGMLSMSHHGIALQRGDRDVMDRERLIRHSFAHRSPEPYVRWTSEQTRSMHLFLDGDLDAAEAAATLALDVGVASGQPEAFMGYAGQVMQIRRAQDRIAEVADDLERIHAENPSLEVFRAALAYVWCELGRESDACDLAETLDLSRGDAPQFWSTSLMLWAEVCNALDLDGPAAQLVPILDGWSDQVASTGATTEGSIARGLGLALATLGRLDDAAAAYDLALSVDGRLRAPLFVARTQLARAELFVDTQPDLSRAIASEASAAIRHHGFARLTRRLDQLVAQLS